MIRPRAAARQSSPSPEPFSGPFPLAAPLAPAHTAAMRYGIRSLLILITVVAAFFGGRATLVPPLRQAEARIVGLQAQVDKLGQQLKQCEVERSARPPKP